MAHGQGGLECRPLSRLDPLVLEDDPGLGEDQPGCLHSAHQVEVGQLHLRHGSSEFKSKESKGAGTVGFVWREWYSQAPIRGRDIFCADAKEHTGEQLRVPCVQIIYGLYSSNRHRRIGALLSGTDTSAIFVLGTRSTKDFWL